MSNVSSQTIKLITSANKQLAHSESNYLAALQRAVRIAYSGDNMDESNYIIGAVPNRIRSVAVSFFKAHGLVVIQNRGELPRVERVEDKSEQKAMFKKLAKVNTLGLIKTSDAETVKAQAEKKEAKELEYKNSTPVQDRTLAVLRKALASVKDDADVNIELNRIIIAYTAMQEKAPELKAA